MRAAGGDGSNRVGDGNSTVARGYEKLKSGVGLITKAMKELSLTIESGQEWPIVTKIWGEKLNSVQLYACVDSYQRTCSKTKTWLFGAPNWERTQLYTCTAVHTYEECAVGPRGGYLLNGTSDCFWRELVQSLVMSKFDFLHFHL